MFREYLASSKKLNSLFQICFYGCLSPYRVEVLRSGEIAKKIDPYTTSQANLLSIFTEGQVQKLRILDLGAGNQWPRKLIEQAGHMYIACDLEDNSNKLLPYDFLVKDEVIPEKSESYDAVLNFSVLEHLPNPSASLSEIYRVLKIDGLLVLQTNFLYREHGAPFDYFRFTVNGLVALLERANFKILEIEKIGSLKTFLWDIVISKHLHLLDRLWVHCMRLRQQGFVNKGYMIFIFGLTSILNFLIGNLFILVCVIWVNIGKAFVSDDQSFYPGVRLIAKKLDNDNVD